MDAYYLDFETKSSLPINKVSTMRYLTTPDSDILCLTWNKNQTKTNLWLPGMPPPFPIKPGDVYIGANISGFDIRVWNMIGVTKYGWTPMPVNQIVDVFAIAGRYGYPQNLDRLGKALKVNTTKDSKGKLFIKRCCVPPFSTETSDLHGLYKYGMRDTDTLIAVANALPATQLDTTETRIWRLTIRMNNLGLPIDMRAVRRIVEVVDHYKKRQVARLPALTDDKVTTAGQVARIKKWCSEKGVYLPALRKEILMEVLKEPNLPPTVREVLQIRLDVGQSSLAKYDKLLDLCWKGHVYDNLRYYRAGTGRFGGMGFQAHNLPRASVEDPDETLERFYDGRILSEDVMFAAKALIRPMIKAPPGKLFCVSDYASIEYVLLMWLAEEWGALRKFAEGRDPYKDQAVALFGKPYEEVTKRERQRSKPVVLGAGYMLGAKGLVAYAKQYGVDMTLEEARAAVKIYRDDKALVRRLWYALNDAALYAVTNREQSFPANGCTFVCKRDRNNRWWLILTLPSGRKLYYNDPSHTETEFGFNVTFMGENSTTHQWIRMELSAPRIIENIIQALGRDLLCSAKLELHDRAYDLRLSVHDEVVVLVPEERAEHDKEYIHKIMSTPAHWCKDLPLRADTFLSKRYKKG